jgi:hypothetical protein
MRPPKPVSNNTYTRTRLVGPKTPRSMGGTSHDEFCITMPRGFP